MLLFKERHIAPILTGAKTETRRVWKRCRAKVGAIHWAQTRMLDTTSRFARVRILAEWHERLGAISAESAAREGGYSVTDFLNVFAEINGSLNLDQEVHVIRFEVVVPTEATE